MTVLIDIDKLKQARKTYIWTQEDLAAASGLSPRTVQRIEASGRCSKDSLKALAVAFDVNAKELLRDDVDMPHKHYDRIWLIGPILGVCGGLFGLSFAWRHIIQIIHTNEIGLMAAMPELMFLCFMTLFTIGFPAYMIHRYWNVSADQFQGCGMQSSYKPKP